MWHLNRSIDMDNVGVDALHRPEKPTNIGICPYENRTRY